MNGSRFDEALARVREAPFVLDGYRATEHLVAAAALESGLDSLHTLTAAALDESDQLTAIAAVHALGGSGCPGAGEVLSDLLSDRRGFVRDHAAWALGAREPSLEAVGRLVDTVVDGDFSGVLAQRTLAKWAVVAPDHVALTLEGALLAVADPSVRARLVETVGLVPGRIASRLIRRMAASVDESFEVRRSAVAAIGDRSDDPFAADVVHQLAGADDELALTAQLAAYDLAQHVQANRGRPKSGLTVAQLFLHADLDHAVSKAGSGDNGGIATLLVRLGAALAERRGIARVLTISRGTAEAALNSLAANDDHQLLPVPLLPEALNSTRAWPAWVAAERGIRRALTAQGPVDVLHLRMGDVGSMAAAAAAQSLNIPVVFTLAPDPHTVIHALDLAGSLTRADFGVQDSREHFWFRLHLVRRLADSASRIVLFPRSELRHDLEELLGLDITADPKRFHIVPEGIDLSVTHHALAIAADPAANADLTDEIRRLPEHRYGLPVAVSVGRLHRVKGMATIVEAWAQDEELRGRCNLVLVGGDLAHPSPDEQGQLDAIAAVLARHPEAADGLVLTGHRSNDTVARWLAAARLGCGEVIAPDGVYVCGSLKEEFGLAILEALATGLVAVAPDGGGPATYIEHGITGVLVPTADPIALGSGIVQALDISTAVDRSVGRSRAQEMVAEKFTVQAMARQLTSVYGEVAGSARTSEAARPRPEMFGLSKLTVVSRRGVLS